MMEDLLYCKNLYKPIKLKEKPSDTFDEDWNVEHRKAQKQNHEGLGIKWIISVRPEKIQFSQKWEKS